MRKIRYLSFRRMFDRFVWLGIGIGIGRYSLIIGPQYDSQNA